MKRGTTDYNFLIAINKPTGMTSHDVINRIRAITGEGRVGHMGTLDPLASGVMIVGVGSAARLNNYLEEADKTYLVTAEFGASTNTYDAEGEATERCEVPSEIMTEEFASDYLAKLVGTHKQTPPAYSAIKIDGKPAYKSARHGETVDLPEREIEIFETELREVSNNKWTFSVTVSKGTYIRSLVNDIGQDLGCGAFVGVLERTSIGDVNLDECYSLEEFEKVFAEGEYRVLDAAELLGFSIVEADEKMMKRVKNGNSLRNNSDWNLFPGAKISIIVGPAKSSVGPGEIGKMDGVNRVWAPGKLEAVYVLEDLHHLVCECKFSGAIQLPRREKYCATLGVFDGLHEGHAFEIEECIVDAKARGCKSLAITFNVDPDEIFKKDFVKLDSNEDRIAKLKASGVDEVRVLDFGEIKDFEGEEFLDKYFGKNTPLSLHIGEGFKLGKNQSGDTDLLIKWGSKHGMDVHVHELVERDGEVISSTRLREKLK